MAKVILSPALTSAKGTTGTITFSRGPFGPTIQAKQSPLQSQSAAQLGIRAGFKALSHRWAYILSSSQQAGWVAFAATHQVSDSLGQLITLTGVQTYIRLNGALRAAGQAIIDTAPGVVTAGAPGALTVTAVATGSPSISVSPASEPGPNDVPIIWSTRPRTIGSYAVAHALTTIKVFPPGTISPWDVLAEWNQHWGIFWAGTVIICKVQYTDSTSGWQGVASVGSGFAT